MDTCVSTKRSKGKGLLSKLILDYVPYTLHFANSLLLVLSFTLI